MGYAIGGQRSTQQRARRFMGGRVQAGSGAAGTNFSTGALAVSAAAEVSPASSPTGKFASPGDAARQPGA